MNKAVLAIFASLVVGAGLAIGQSQPCPTEFPLPVASEPLKASAMPAANRAPEQEAAGPESPSARAA